MDSPKNVMRNIVPLLRNREIGIGINKRCNQFTKRFIKNLMPEGELKEWNYVSSMNWNYNGSLLAIASTYGSLCIWDPFVCKIVSIPLPTPQPSSITSVRFVGDSHASVATTSKDGVVVRNWGSNTVVQRCTCHPGGAGRVETAPGEPYLFWSTGNKGLVMRHDLRAPHQCFDPSSLIINLSPTNCIRCIAVNPKRSHYIAVGCEGSYIRLYDTRMVRTTQRNNTPTHHSFDAYECNSYDPSCVQYYAPGNLTKNVGAIATSIAFNAAGSEMIVSFWPELIYLFDLNNPRNDADMMMHIPESVTKRITESTGYCCQNTSPSHINENGASCACYYMKKATDLYKRKWIGDFYDAARYYLHVINKWPNNRDAYLGLILCLIQLKWHREAAVWLEYYQKADPVWENHEKVVEVYNQLQSSREKWGDRTSFQDESYDIEESLKIKARDYELRFRGYISRSSEVNFLGEEGKYICAASENGKIFFWDRETTEIVNCLRHQEVITSIQPHPSTCLIATGGLSPAVELWSPLKKGFTE